MKRGDRVLLLLENGEEYVISYYAALKAGMVAVPMSAETRSDALKAIVEAITPMVVIASPKAEKSLFDICDSPSPLHSVLFTKARLAWQLRNIAVLELGDLLRSNTACPAQSLDESSLASIIFTSGSTGKPKGVMLTHENIVANTNSIVQCLHLSHLDRQMVILPFFYVMGKSLLNTHIAVGGSLVINNTFAYPASVLKQMAAEEVTGFSGVPSTYAYLLHRSPLKSYKDKLPALRYCSQAGGHMFTQIKEELLATLPDHTKLYIMYGATEASARLSYVEPERIREKMTSIGIPIPGVSLKILDDSGKELNNGELGEVVASGANIMRGYWSDPQASAAVLSPNGYRTGDIGYRDKDGYFHLAGRKDNQLKVGGHRINPQEIEDTLMATGLLIEVAVIGVEDPLAGHKLIAIAVPIDVTTSKNSILIKCIELLPRYKVPSEIRIVNKLPKNNSGKIDKVGCAHLIDDSAM
jgi:acyl-CoA synthetase (AMP-forming)/AMP-acid ligase II